MNVNEAIEVITGAEPSCLEHVAGTVLAAEVERLRAELAEAKASNKVWRDVSMKLQGTLLRQHDELAAAKAASVWKQGEKRWIGYIDEAKERGKG